MATTLFWYDALDVISKQLFSTHSQERKKLRGRIPDPFLYYLGRG